MTWQNGLALNFLHFKFKQIADYIDRCDWIVYTCPSPEGVSSKIWLHHNDTEWGNFPWHLFAITLNQAVVFYCFSSWTVNIIQNRVFRSNYYQKGQTKFLYRSRNEFQRFLFSKLRKAIADIDQQFLVINSKLESLGSNPWFFLGFSSRSFNIAFLWL